MSLGLPKGTFRPLAKLLWPVAIWLGIGWAALPTLYLKIDPNLVTIGDGNTMAAYGIAIACICSGVILLIYSIKGPELDESEFDRLANATMACPYCGNEMDKNAESCAKCGRTIPY